MRSPTGKTAKQKTAEAAIDHFKKELGPFVVAAETTRMAMLFTDANRPGSPIIFVNESFLKLTGYSREEVLGKSIIFLLEDENDEQAIAQISAEFSAHATGVTELFYHRKTGPPFWGAVFVSPVRDVSGNVVQHFCSFIDLSIHKDEEALARTLIDELNHRVKNTLATVRSIVSQGLRSSINIDEIGTAIEARLFALSRSHDLLARENWKSAGLRDLVQEVTRPFVAVAGQPKRFVVTGSDVRLSPNLTLAFGIALNELATNAAKYGALSNNTGTVSISWGVEASSPGQHLRICWEESDGPPVFPPTRKGFGTRVIERGLTHELGALATLEYLPSGLRCIVDIPLPESVN